MSYEPAIIIATPGRLWELLNERNNPYLNAELPLIDILVLDEADRMIEDGHFKELKLLLDFIYTKRVEYKKHGRIQPPKVEEEDQEVKDSKRLYKEELLKINKSKKAGHLQPEFAVKSIEKSGNVDLSQVVDLYDEDGMLDEINAEDLVIEADEEEEKERLEEEKKTKKTTKRKDQVKTTDIARRSMAEEGEFAKDYKKVGGIQHIICSATMTIDNSGRVTPR